MKSPLPRYLEHVLADCKEDSGETAQYIPELAAANPDHFGVALCTIDGDMYAAGDADIEFAIESISKAFAYAIALTDRGFDGVAKKVGVEPSGDAFNKLSVNSKTGLPDNPLINAGAITTHTLVNGKTPRERYDRVAEIMSKCAGRKLRVMEDVYSSEMKTADRNRALAYMLHMTGIIEDDPMAAVEYYTRQCSLAVTAKDLAAMVATLANRGIQPVTKEVIFTPEVCVRVQSVMLTCGMYDYAGDWVTAVGIPSKSGVGGGIIGTVPGQVGIATFSPKLEEHGNSYRGIKVFEHMSHNMGLHMLKTDPPCRSVIRRDKTVVRQASKDGQASKVRVISLQGSVNFVAAEQVTLHLADLDKDVALVLDLRSVTAIYEAGRMLLTAAIEILLSNGQEVSVIDHHHLLPKDRMKGANRVANLKQVVPDHVAHDNQVQEM